MPAELEAELIALGPGTGIVSATGDALNAPSSDDLDVVARANAIAAESWFAVSNWAKNTDNLQSWQRSILFSIGRLRSSDRSVSVKQATQGLKAIEQARELGWSESKTPL